MMHRFAREQQPYYQGTNSSRCESQLSRKTSSTADPKATANSPIGTGIGLLIDSSRATILPLAAREKLPSIPAATLQRIRIHDDDAAHQAADKLNARAFTIGPSIYFGRGEYQPSSQIGMRVLAHETAHAHQQANTSLPPTDQLLVSDPSSKEEHAADAFAANVSNGKVTPPPAQVSSGSISRLMRVTFEGIAEEPVLADIKDSIKPAPYFEDEAFAFGYGNPTLFTWSGSATMHGTPAPGSDWRIGMIHTLKDYWMRIWWAGEDTPNCVFTFKDKMIKDSTTSISDIGTIRPTRECPFALNAEEPWFNYCSKSEPFVQDGQKQDVSMEDSPGFLYVPYRKPKDNPKAKGHFDFGATFFGFLSAYNSGAQQSPDEPQFQHLKSVYWQTMFAGNFNGDRAPGKRWKITEGGATEAQPVRDYTPDGPQPTLWGITGNELLEPVFECVTKDPKDTERKQ